MKPAAVLLAGAALVSAIETKIETFWVTDIVTVTVTEDAPDFVQASKPTSSPKPVTTTPKPVTPTPEPVTHTPVPVTTSSTTPVADTAAIEDTSSKAPAPVTMTTTSTTTPKPAVTSTSQPAPEALTASGGSGSTGPLGEYEKTVLKHHNAPREDHSAGPLEWDMTLAGYAANVASSCIWGHNSEEGGGGYGQNIASFGASGDLGTKEDAAIKAIAGWYAEAKDYTYYGQDQPPAAVFGNIGHFTQLVWNDTTTVGCATAQCEAGKILSFKSYYTVCNYGPAGNVRNMYALNVLAPKGKINLA